jgi:hypothetical protein
MRKCPSLHTALFFCPSFFVSNGFIVNAEKVHDLQVTAACVFHLQQYYCVLIRAGFGNEVEVIPVSAAGNHCIRPVQRVADK